MNKSLELIDVLPQPKDVIAHREPFLFVDKVTQLVPGLRATGIWNVTGDEPFLAGHFPGNPIVPGVLICEAIAQLGAVAVLSDERYEGRLPLFGGLDKARFRRQIVPGDTVELNVEMIRLRSKTGSGSGTAKVNGEIAVECQMMFVIV